MPKYFGRDGGPVLEVEQEWIDITSGNESIDITWRQVDKLGHEHYYQDGQYPTLDFVIDQEHWCDGSEGWERHDPHQVIDEYHYLCKQCGEVVKPGVWPPYHPQKIKGNVSYWLSGQDDKGANIERMWIRPEEYEGMFSTPNLELRQARAQVLINIHGRERCRSWTIEAGRP